MHKTITLLDGATGTTLWARSGNTNPVWTYNIKQPNLVKQVAREYADAGARIVCSNTFAANAFNIHREGKYDMEQVVTEGVRLVRDAVSHTDALVALDCGPLSTMLQPFGYLKLEDCKRYYEELISMGMQEKPDLIFLMTFTDLDMLRVAVKVAKQYHVPVFASMTFNEYGTTLMGNNVSDIVRALEPMGVDAMGMNCSPGVEKGLEIIKQFRKYTSLPTIFKPDAGHLYRGKDTETPEQFAESLVPAFPYVDFLGGCCGSNAEHIKALRKKLASPK